ncbi:D-galactarate dehydratase [Pelagovum pacificum]|uniref:D-galactarate dehydratase n=1 Tax=Pelagovum pacificum TaxID=2588711 RepID=A0A5C5GHS2_9RHOB|nr:D-galactarate dehydratase [Pelagovum pacificum]
MSAVQTLDPTPPPPPPAEARTADQFDTTTDEDRAEATAEPSSASTELGTTLATLGSPADPGIWLKTPFVSEVTAGRVEYEGSSINIELRPSGGAAGSGSQISLPAMRLLEAPLTDIVELTVFSG